MQRRGVCFVASDSIYDLAVAFLKSFRIHNPSSPLCLIPYDSETTRLSALAEQYDFTCFSDQSALARCDEIAGQIHGRKWGHYRKLACWHGPFDEFIYIDSDTVVTGSVGFIYERFSGYEFLFSHSDFPALRPFVWKETICQTAVLTNAQISFSANTGFIYSKRGALTIDEAERRLPDALQIVNHMELSCIEQPFLNYLVVTSGKPYTSLSKVIMTTHATDLPVEKWGGQKLKILRKENCRTSTETILLVHWAGEWRPRGIERWLYTVLRKLGYKGWLPSVRLFMPNARLWRYYRYRPERFFSRSARPSS